MFGLPSRVHTTTLTFIERWIDISDSLATWQVLLLRVLHVSGWLQQQGYPSISTYSNWSSFRVCHIYSEKVEKSLTQDKTLVYILALIQLLVSCNITRLWLLLLHSLYTYGMISRCHHVLAHWNWNWKQVTIALLKMMNNYDDAKYSPYVTIFDWRITCGLLTHSPGISTAANLCQVVGKFHFLSFASWCWITDWYH
jgi:hypothetical protein